MTKFNQRNFEAHPYSEDEKRVAEFLFERCEIGGGDDPIGFILASHAYLAAQRNALLAAAVELDRLSLVIESAVRNCEPKQQPAVVTALRANRTACATATGCDES